MTKRRANLYRGYFGFVWLILATSGCNDRAQDAASSQFRWDLGAYGFATESKGRIIGNFTDLNFLSDDLVLVAVNQKIYQPIEPSNSDQPPSTLLLLDVVRRNLVRTVELDVEKEVDSVKATTNGQFVILAESGLRLCSIELRCGPPLQTRGPMLISPRGSRLLLGGNGQTDRMLIDSSSMREISSFSSQDSLVVPGDNSLLIQRSNKLYLHSPGRSDLLFPFSPPRFGLAGQFLNDDKIGLFESDTILAVLGFDGKLLYRVPILTRRNGTGIVPAFSGTRFCIHESGYTQWNAILHFYDIEDSRPRDLERVRILDTNSGEERFEFTWDPRPFVGRTVLPAISPSGRRMALIRHGTLEVFEIN